MAADRKNEPKLADVAAKTTAALENLRSRLNRSGALEAAEIGDQERPDDLEGELEKYFAAERIATPPPKRSIPVSTSAEIMVSKVGPKFWPL